MPPADPAIVDTPAGDRGAVAEFDRRLAGVATMREMTGGLMKRGPMWALVSFLIAVASGVLVTTVLVPAWPAEMELTAPLLCPEDHPHGETQVERGYDSAQGADTYNYTLFCVDSGGDVVDAGALQPFAILSAAHATVIFVVLLVAGTLGRRLLGGAIDVLDIVP